MNNELIIALLAIGFVGSLAAMFIFWAKYDEQKKLTKEEREKRWDEISRAVGLENEIERLTERLSCINDAARFQFERGVDLYQKNIKLQDKLSALLCPTNNHVWVDGCCIKCGRSEEK